MVIPLLELGHFWSIFSSPFWTFHWHLMNIQKVSWKELEVEVELFLEPGRILFIMLFGLHKHYYVRGEYPFNFLFVVCFLACSSWKCKLKLVLSLTDLWKMLINAYCFSQMRMILLVVYKEQSNRIWRGLHCSVLKYWMKGALMPAKSFSLFLTYSCMLSLIGCTGSWNLNWTPSYE